MNTVDLACKVAAFPKPGGLGQGKPGSGVFSGNLAVVAACYLSVVAYWGDDTKVSELSGLREPNLANFGRCA